MRIAFICTANVCRSVMAHAILEKIVGSGSLGIEVTSAGIIDFTGTPPAENSWLTCLQNDVPVSKMEALFVGNLDLERVDHFLVMEKSHRKVLLEKYEIDPKKVHLLGIFDKVIEEEEIVDPINRPKAEFQECFERIERCIEGFLAENQRAENEAPRSRDPKDEE